MTATDLATTLVLERPPSPRARLDHAFAALRRQGIAALPGFGCDPVGARLDVVEELAHRRPQGAGWYALCTEPDHRRCFDERGALVAPLPVHHHPAVGAAVVAALGKAGLAVVARGSDRLVVEPAPA